MTEEITITVYQSADLVRVDIGKDSGNFLIMSPDAADKLADNLKSVAEYTRRAMKDKK